MHSARLFIVGLLFALSSVNVLGADSCPEVVEQVVNRNRAAGEETLCQCGAELKNLIVSVPHGFNIIGICDFRSSNGNRIDLRKGPQSLDQFRKDGTGYWADVYFSGNAVLRGTVQAGPADNSGNMWFFPRPSMSTSMLKAKSPAFASYFGEGLRLDHDNHGKMFKSPYKGGSSQNVGALTLKLLSTVCTFTCQSKMTTASIQLEFN